MDPDQAAAFLEAVLFLESEPVDIAALSRITGLNRREIRQAIDELHRLYTLQTHGLEVVELGGGFTLSVKQHLWDQLKNRYGKRSEGKLSRAALETLSIIAYSQPVTRQEIESIRGVSADGMIKLLSGKNLIREVGKKEVPGRPVQYGTTKEFLKVFRLASIADLPKLDEMTEEKFE